MSFPFKPRSGAVPFIIYSALWGVLFGCFMSTLNNYLTDIHGFSPKDRGWLEFFRELPGLSLVFILALMYKVSDWKIMRWGAAIATVGVTALVLPVHYAIICFFITVWALGEHIIMPVRGAVAMQLAKPDKGGRALGFLSSIGNAGMILGFALVWSVFRVGPKLGFKPNGIELYNTVWLTAGALAFITVLCTLSKHVVDVPSKRPKLLIRKKFSIFYALELSYGARKQIFLTFAPMVLIKIYEFRPEKVAELMAVSALVNMFFGPWVGRLTDRLGYRTIMIADTLILFWVCLLYGFAHVIFPPETHPGVAVRIVIVNFLLDTALSTTSMATSLYVKSVASNQDELTSTLSTGISANHLVAIIAAPLGGWVWVKYGVETLFVFSAIAALINSGIAALIPRREPKINT
ncbi:MAG: MFS transporter [Kiritimatiellaeota bacterium]|nr:MFS transporter [Kiritimatiellota bacterium]